MVHSTLGSGGSRSILHWLLFRQSLSVVQWVLGNLDPSCTGSWAVVVRPTLGPGESWSILNRSRGPSGAWSWGFVVHSALGSGGLCPFYTGSCSFLHWVLGGHVHPTLAPEKCRVSFCTGFWGMMSILHCPRRESRSILHWVLGVGPSHTTS